MKAVACTIAAIMASAVMAAPFPGRGDLPSVSGLPTPSVSVAPVATAHVNGNTGEIVTDAGTPVQNVLTVTGEGAKQLLLQLSPEVAGLLSGLGLPQVGVPVGSIVASASSVGDLVKDLAPDVKGLLTVVGTDGKYLLIQLSPSVAGLISGLGLPGVGVPVGAIVATVGEHVKRQDHKLVNDLGKPVGSVLTVTGQDAKKLLIELSPEVASLLTGLGLPAVGVPVGSIVASAGSVGDLLKDISPDVKGLLTVVSQDGGFLLVQLSAPVAGLVSGVGLPAVGVPVGTVVETVGNNL